MKKKRSPQRSVHIRKERSIAVLVGTILLGALFIGMGLIYLLQAADFVWNHLRAQ